MFLFDWIPQQPAAIVAKGLEMASPFASGFAIACLPLFILCLLSLSSRWVRFTDKPIIFAITHSIPFFLFSFQDSLGDSGQVISGVRSRYHMSEPLASWAHYWFFSLLHEPFNIGAKDAIALTSRVGGFFYLWFVAKISIQLFSDLSPSRRLVHRLIFTTASVAFLFYGYVENPPLALPGEQLWVLTSLVFLQIPSLKNLAMCSAALALATAFHGRVGFLFPALAFGCLIPTGTLFQRLQRLIFGSTVYFGLLSLMVAYIFLLDRSQISGGPYGNVLGGGNRQMFVAIDHIFSREHWEPLFRAMLVAGGAILPFALIRLVTMWYKPSATSIWCFGYLLANIVYLLLWEFDYGPYLDWDLVFSAVCPLLLIASIFVTRSKIPLFCIVPLLLATTYLSHTWVTLVNGGPLVLNLAPRASAPTTSVSCKIHGLKRTYYTEPELSTPVSTPEADIPYHEYGSIGIPFPVPGKPLGAIFEGYISIPKTGRYRFFILGQGNVRLSIAGHRLVNKWIGYEWRVSSEREINFELPGYYPIRIEFFSISSVFPLQLEIESAEYERRKITNDELCYSS